MNDYYITEPCKCSGGLEIKLKDGKIDLRRAEAAFSQMGQVLGGGPVVLLARVGQYDISVYQSGRLMVKGPDLDNPRVDALAHQIMAALERTGAIL